MGFFNHGVVTNPGEGKLNFNQQCSTEKVTRCLILPMVKGLGIYIYYSAQSAGVVEYTSAEG